MVINADARHMPLADESVQCCITSPPYYGLRDYGADGQIGLEASLQDYIASMVEVFAEVWRVLRKDGTCWLNLGDSYASKPVGSFNGGGQVLNGRNLNGRSRSGSIDKVSASGLKPKDLMMVPHRVAIALQEWGWYIRQDIVWAKPNPMPESVADRCTKAHEYVFLMTKSQRYYYNADAIREDAAWERWGGQTVVKEQQGTASWIRNKERDELPNTKRNKRSVWTVSTQPFSGAHFATFPPNLIEPMVCAGTKQGDIILDPFCGTGTVGMVARKHQRKFVGLDVNMAYLRDLALPRSEQTQTRESLSRLPLFST